MTGYLEQKELLPGFVAGYSRIHHDELRQIAYGTRFLRDAVAEDPALAEVVRETLRGLPSVVAQSLTPPERREPDWDALGAGPDEIHEFALRGLNRRLAVIGVPLSTL